MSEKGLRNVFLFGTLLCLVILGVMAADTLSQVRNLRTPALSEEVIAGKETWQAQNCNDCHTILGIGGYFAPDLTTVTIRRDPTWLNSFLLDSQAAKPGTTMPNQALTAAQANQLVGFFQWVAKVDTNGWPPQPMVSLGGAAPSSAAAVTSGEAAASEATPEDPIVEGQRIYAKKGCSACHMINGLGAGGPGPDLSTIGSQPYDNLPNDAEYLALWLENPLAQKPDTTMPRINLNEAEIDALVAYLTSLK
jgi:nitric oxide reductase subunit C